MGSHRVGHDWSDLAAACTLRGFPGSSDGKESACKAGHLGLIPGREDPLEKGMATHSSIHAWKIPWTKEPGGLQSMGSQRVRHDWATSFHFIHVKIKPEETWRENKRNKKNNLVSLMNMDTKFLYEIVGNQIQQHIKKGYMPWPSRICPRNPSLA